MKDAIEVKTSDLIGPRLDWAVALATEAEELKVTAAGKVSCIYEMPCGSGCWTNLYQPSADWSQAGPLIDKHLVCLTWLSKDEWRANPSKLNAPTRYGSGETALIAACRAIVTYELGDTVSVPAELVPT